MHFLTSASGWAVLGFIFLASGSVFAQSLTLSSASAAPGATVALNLTLAGADSQPAGLQWTLTYTPGAIVALSATAGPVLQSSGKTISCAAAAGSYTCLATGLNANTIPDGVAATVSITVASLFTTSAPIGIGGVLGVSLAGSSIPFTGTGGSVTPSVPLPPVIPSASATFISLNTALQGQWKSAYGSDGYALAADLTRYPAYATVAVSAPAPYIWAPSSTDTRALQKATSATDRLAAAWYGSALSIDVNLTDGGTHQVGLYCLDWDNSNRAEVITVVDANTKAVLDTRTVSGFGTGQYVAWDVSGHVTIQVALSSGPNVVVSGIFFGENATMPAASFLSSDTATQGSWQSVYGAEGYNVIGSAAAYPGYAAVTATGTQQYVWSGSTSDPRALQKPSNSADRLAATWYSATAFAINVKLSDTVPHQVALYFLDWDARQRGETVTVLNPATNAVLDTRTVANFSGGQYLIWNVRGSIRIVVTRTSGPNAVLSGIFFGGAPHAPAADFVTMDVSTQGTWSGVYGADGYNVLGDLTSYPSYVTVTPAGLSSYTWSSSTTDPRALQRASNPTSRVAAAWYSGAPSSIDLNFSNTVPYRVAVYCLDWDNRQRVQLVSVVDAATNAILDSRVIANFSGGEYVVWNLTGHVKLVLAPVVGINAVVSGMFFR